MNAYELEQAAFDSACDYAEETIEYIKGYASGAFDLTVSDAVAQKILDCRAAAKKMTEENGEGQNNGSHLVQVPLEEIELSKVNHIEALQAAIEKTETSGFPGAWSVETREDGDTLLVWTCDEKDVPDMDGDEPWTKGGGYEIIKTAGIGDYSDKDSGADAYQDKYGDNVVTQWVCFPK